MTDYGILNVFLLTAGATALLLWTTTWREMVSVVRTAGAITLLAFPWDHFAIRWGAWAHTDPGPELFGVPVNDLLMCFACTLFSASLLNHSFHRNRRRESESEREGGTQEDGDG